MVAKPLCPLYKKIIKPLDKAHYPELRYIFTIFCHLILFLVKLRLLDAITITAIQITLIAKIIKKNDILLYKEEQIEGEMQI